MHVVFERSGGFTGIPMTVTIDSSDLSPQEETELRHLVEAADFFDLPETVPQSPAAPQPDRFQYSITVEQNSRHHTVTMAEQAVPDSVRPLLDWLTEAARRQRS